jgi:hypothetical protein
MIFSYFFNTKTSLIFLLIFVLIPSLFCQNTTLFSDNFETPQTWTIFEEIVAGNACYANNIGQVGRSTEVVFDGTNALRVWSNMGQTTKSNHVIAAHHISTTQGITGRLRFGTWVYNATNLGLTQSSPELSLQSTRTVGSQNLTFIAGIQYIGNQWIADKWNVWHNGQWQAIKATEWGTTLVANTWYYLELEFDLTTNKYIGLKIQGGGINQFLDLSQPFQNAPSGFQIGGEARNWTPSYFVTLESENLWTGCAQNHENKVFYDQIFLESLTVLPINLIEFKGISEGNKNHLFIQFSDVKNISKIELEKSNNGKDFIKLIELNPLNFNQKDIYDNDPFDLTYYRINTIEMDGKSSFSPIISVKKAFILRGPLKVFPNPANAILFIENVENKDIEIVNILGQKVMAFKSEINHSQLNIDHLKSGIYFVKSGNEMVRFVKE